MSGKLGLHWLHRFQSLRRTRRWGTRQFESVYAKTKQSRVKRWATESRSLRLSEILQGLTRGGEGRVQFQSPFEGQSCILPLAHPL